MRAVLARTCGCDKQCEGGEEEVRGSAELRLHFVACGRSARVTDGRCTAGGGRLDLLSLVKMAQTQTRLRARTAGRTLPR